jgi:hypothetical protein
MCGASHCPEMPVSKRGAERRRNPGFAAPVKLEFNKAQELSEGDPDMPELSAYA